MPTAKQTAQQTLGIELRRARIACNWTLVEVADALGVAPSVICRRERGNLMVPALDLLRLARLLGLDLPRTARRVLKNDRSNGRGRRR